MSSYPESPLNANDQFLFYTAFADTAKAVTIDTVLTNIVPLLARGEFAINELLAQLATIDPGQLDQSRLMSAQMNMSRWQLAAQLLSNFASGVASGLKSTVQNVGR